MSDFYIAASFWGGVFKSMQSFLRTRPARMAGLFIFVTCVSGCGADGVREESAKPPFDKLRTGQAAVEAPSVSLTVTDAAGLRDAIARHRGEVVLVDFWATWCLPCVEQFPHTVEMARNYRERGLTVISVSMDSPKSEPQVRAFLEQQRAEFENFIGSYAGAVEATKAFGLPGPVPCYRVYDRDGELRREFSVDPRSEKQFTADDVEAKVVELL
jgi:thiol-disulfide isomerase/thioredoxin